MEHTLPKGDKYFQSNLQTIHPYTHWHIGADA